jgi:uncharacterized membrane protein YqjE
VIDPNAGIPDLLRRLVDDSKRLAQDEVRLAKLELRERAHDATRGGIWLGVAAGAAIAALIALTVCLAALIGHAIHNHYWAGTLIVAVVELALGALLVLRGLKQLKQAQITLPETREEAVRTARWAKSAGTRVAADVREARRTLAGQPFDPSMGHVEIPIARRD